MKTCITAVLLWSTLSNAQRQRAHTILLGLPTQEATPSSTTNDLCTAALLHCEVANTPKHESTTVHHILNMFQCMEPIVNTEICKPDVSKHYVEAVDELAACARFAQKHSLCPEWLEKAYDTYDKNGVNFRGAMMCLQSQAARQYDFDGQLCLRYKYNNEGEVTTGVNMEHDETLLMAAPLASKGSVVGNALGGLFHGCTPKDPTTAKHCLKTSRSFFNPLTFLKCVCDECDAESEYDRFGDCVIIPHCTEYEHCADCGCGGYLCCIKCEGNWVPNDSIGPEECMCPEPFKETADGQCA